MQGAIERVKTAKRPTIAALAREGCLALGQSGIESARLDAEILLRHVLNIEAAEFYRASDARVSRADEERFRELVRRRGRREPVAYITGTKEFWSLDFMVTPDVLIPRPDTELLVEVALNGVRQRPRRTALTILDLCTGSGAVAVCLAKELAGARLTALDISAAALTVARLNAEKHAVADQIQFTRGDLFSALLAGNVRFDLIVCNPPYVRRRDLAGLPADIRDWEPAVALDGGDDGLGFYRRIIADAVKYTIAGGLIALEIADDMADAVVRLFAADGSYQPAMVYRDYAGKDRVIAAQTLDSRGLCDG